MAFFDECMIEMISETMAQINYTLQSRGPIDGPALYRRIPSSKFLLHGRLLR